MKIEDVIASEEGSFDKGEAAHLFGKAIQCLKREMPNRAHAHIRASKRSVVDEMVDSENSDLRKFHHKCYLMVEELEIYIRRHI